MTTLVVIMRSWTVAIVLICCLALLLAPSSGAEAQDGDTISIESRLTITALDTLEGRGSVQYYIEGAPASALRTAFLTSFDANRNLYVDASEVIRFLADLGDELEGRQYWGVAIENPTNYSAMTESDVTNRTSGFVSTFPSSTDPISFGYDFETSGESTTKLLRLSELAVQTFMGSVEAVAGLTFEGTLEVSDRVMMFGLASFTTPDLIDGKISELRTPIGSVMWYSFSAEVGTANPPASETLTFERFNLLENQQMAFIVLVIACTLILRVPAKSFEKYRLQHPKKFRKSAKPLPTVRVFSWSIVAVLCALYLLPFMFSFADRNLLIYSSYLYILAPAAVLGTYLFTRGMYSMAALRIPEDIVIEVKQALVRPDGDAGELRCQICMMPIDAGLDLYECVCGYAMHMACAQRLQTCPQCAAVLFPEHTRSIECKSCGETFLTSGEEDPFALQCTKCGAFQEEVKPSKNYLVVDVDAKRAYNMIRSMGLSGRPAMVLTSEFPGKVREENELGDDFEVKWLTESSGDIDSVNIKDLDGDVMEAVSTFLMTTKRSGLLMDGIEAIVSENGFEAALAFVKRMNDLATIHGASVMMWIDRNRMPEDQNIAISDEFDEIHDYL